MAQPSSQQSSHILAVVGGALVVLGIVALIFASWGSFTPSGRMLATALPLAAVYGLSFWGYRQQSTRDIGRYALVTASIIMPFVLGVLIYQSGLYADVDGQLITLLALASAANAGVIELYYRERSHTAVTLVSLLVATGGFVYWMSLDGLGIVLSILLAGFLMQVVGRIQNPEVAGGESVAAWHYVGSTVVLLGLFALPHAVLSLMNGESPYGWYALHPLFLSLMYVGVGIINLFVAAWYSRQWQEHRHQHALLALRRLFERTSAAFMVLPPLLYTLSSDTAGPFLVLLGASLLALGLSLKVRVAWFRSLAVAGFVVGLIRLILLGLRELSAAWPIVLMVVGIAFLTLALLGARGAKDWLQPLFTLPKETWEGLGEEPAEKKPAAKGMSSGWLWFAVALLALFLLSQL